MSVPEAHQWQDWLVEALAAHSFPTKSHPLFLKTAGQCQTRSVRISLAGLAL